MPIPRDPDTLRIPAFMRRHRLKSKAKELLPRPIAVMQKVKVAKHVKPMPGSSSTFVKTARARPSNKPARAKKIHPRMPAFAPPIFEAPIFEAPKKKRSKEVGVLTHYYDKIKVGVIKLSGALDVGDEIAYETPGGRFEQTVTSMEINRSPVFSARRGQEIGIKLAHGALVGSRVQKSSA